LPAVSHQMLHRRQYRDKPLKQCRQILETGESGCIFVSGKTAMLGSVICLGWAIAAISALQGWFVVAMALTILLIFLGFFLLRQVFGYWNCLSILFWLAHGLYAVSGPLSWYIQKESVFFHEHIKYADLYVSFCALASLSFVLGTILPTLKHRQYNTRAIGQFLHPYALRASSLALLAVAFVLEMTRLSQPQYREALILGKIYVGFVEGYTSPIIAHLIYTSALLGTLFIIQKQISTPSRVKFVLLWLLMCSPTIITSLIVGGRGLFIGLFFTIFFSNYLIIKFRKITVRLLTVMLAMYLLFVVIYWARGLTGGLVVGATDSKELISTITENINLNPASVEFAAPFVNFNIFYASAETLPLQYGATYIDGILSVIEYLAYGKLRPNTTELFHQIFYPEALDGGYGNGFSSIVEAYWNFGVIGVLVVYFLFGLILSQLEIKVNLKPFSPIHLLYINLIPAVVIIHRSNLGLTFWLLPIIIAVSSYTCYKSFELLLSRWTARCR